MNTCGYESRSPCQHGGNTLRHRFYSRICEEKRDRIFRVDRVCSQVKLLKWTIQAEVGGPAGRGYGKRWFFLTGGLFSPASWRHTVVFQSDFAFVWKRRFDFSKTPSAATRNEIASYLGTTKREVLNTLKARHLGFYSTFCPNTK